MATTDAEGNYVHQESDPAAPGGFFSALLNKINTTLVNLVRGTDARLPQRGKNLFNPATRMIGYGMSSAGTGAAPTPLAGYSMSEFIPVKAGQQYTLSSARNYARYTTAQVYIAGSYVSNAAQTPATITAAVDGYMRAAIQDAKLPTFQIESGAAATSYESYRHTLSTLVVDPSQVENGLSVSRSGNAVTVVTDLDGQALTMVFDLAGSGNALFNFGTVTIAGATVATAGDDATPIRTQQDTIGANHGFSTIGVWPSGTHDKTAADLGSVWTDGTRQYAILQIDATGACIVGGDYVTAGDGSRSSAVVAPTVNLTHVSGATHTTALVYTSRIAGQLWPSVQRIKRAVSVDRKPLAAGTTRGTQLVIKESYDILDYASVYDLAKANIGVSYATLLVQTAVRVESTWTIRPGGKMLADFALTEMSPTKFASGGTGFLQMQAITGTVTRYLPGVKTIGGLDWSAGVSLASLVSDQLVTTSDLWNAAVPPTVLVDVRSDIAAVVAYEPWTDDTRNSARLASIPTRLWDLRATKKVYPMAVGVKNPGWGRLVAHGIRSYLSPTQAATVTSSGKDALAASAALATLHS